MVDNIRKEKLEALVKSYKLTISDYALLNQAFTHKSYVNEIKKTGVKLAHNEKLEFFGDAVLKLVVSEYLYKKYPKKTEGQLSRMRSYLVCDETLAEICQEKGFNKLLLLGISEKNNKGMERTSNSANLLEALFGAIYLDAGIAQADSFINNIFTKSYENVSISNNEMKDFKSILQEYVQDKGWSLPEYKTIKETGPDHEKIFHIQVKAGKGILGMKSAIGKEKTKKKAEQIAAKEVLEKLN